MIIDINCWLGHYPYRRLRHNDAEGLVAQMNTVGIDRAIVSSIDALFYKNTQAGNEELAAAVAPHRDHLIPFATINPSYAGWERDLTICHETEGMRGIRAFPHYHGYDLDDARCRALLGAAAERGLPVAFCARLVDRRQHHWLDVSVDPPPQALAALVAAHPENRFMILNSLSPAEEWAPAAEADVLWDISRMTALPIALGPASASIPAMLQVYGPGRLAFGTGMPFKVPHPALLKLTVLGADASCKAAIASGNAARMLGIDQR